MDLAATVGKSASRTTGGWTLVGGLLLVMTVCHGTITSALPTLDSAILEELGISRGALKLRESLFLMASGLSGLAIGFLTQRIRPAHIVLAGLCLLAATLFAYSRATSITQIYFLYVLLGLCFASAHVVIVVLMIRERFDDRRSLATSVALSGTSLGAAIFPNISVWAQEHMPWRDVLLLLALLPLIILPFAAFLTRGSGRKPVAVTAPVEAPLARKRGSPLALALLMVATFGTFFGSTAFLLNLFLYLQDIGMAQRLAAAGMSLVFILGLAGKVLVGLAAERWGNHPVWTSQQALLLIGAIVLTTGSPALAFVGLAFLGLGWAGCYVLTQIVIADYFAGPKLGQRTGMFIVFEAIASGSGVWIAGSMFDHFGSYRPAFLLCCILITVALAAGIMFRRVAKRQAAFA